MKLKQKASFVVISIWKRKRNKPSKLSSIQAEPEPKVLHLERPGLGEKPRVLSHLYFYCLLEAALPAAPNLSW